MHIASVTPNHRAHTLDVVIGSSTCDDFSIHSFAGRNEASFNCNGTAGTAGTAGTVGGCIGTAGTFGSFGCGGGGGGPPPPDSKSK